MFSSAFSNGFQKPLSVTIDVKAVSIDTACVTFVDRLIRLGEIAEVTLIAPPGIYTVTSSVIADSIPDIVIAPEKAMGHAKWTPTQSGTVTVSKNMPSASYTVVSYY